MEHPITPPTELVAQWLKQFYGLATRLGTLAPGEASLHVAAQAAQWGADQELEACCEWLDSATDARDIRIARRPKSPSLKEQVLDVMDTAIADGRLSFDASILVRLLVEALPND